MLTKVDPLTNSIALAPVMTKPSKRKKAHKKKFKKTPKKSKTPSKKEVIEWFS
jgi:hypothetical protein